MSQEIVQSHIENLLLDEGCKVIALSGKWGTGKSFLWLQIKKSSTSAFIKNSLYASMFGVKGINDLKLKLIQGVVPDSQGGQATKEIIKTGLRETKGFLKSLHPAFAALDDVVLLAIPQYLKNRLVVIDDIERRHSNFSIDELMGFIDEFTQIYKVRFVLILNSDKLSNDSKESWSILHEKVIDHEIKLETTSVDAFTMALTEVPSDYSDRIKSAIGACGVSNIRIIRKVIRSVNLILEGKKGLRPEVLQRIIPSTVLLASIHYRGLDDGPDVEFVLNFNSYTLFAQETDQDEVVKKQHSSWKQLMQRLEISECDEFEHAVVEYLKSGLLNKEQFRLIFDDYISQEDAHRARNDWSHFIDLVNWHPELTDDYLLHEAAKQLESLKFLDPYFVTHISRVVRELQDGVELADQIIKVWLEEFNNNSDTKFKLDSHSGNPIHSDLKSALEALDAKSNPPLSLYGAIERLSKRDSWGRAEESVLKNATKNDFIAEMQSLSGKNLKLFMMKNVDLHIHKNSYAQPFGSAMENFVLACREICQSNGNLRLVKIVKRLLESSHISLDN